MHSVLDPVSLRILIPGVLTLVTLSKTQLLHRVRPSARTRSHLNRTLTWGLTAALSAPALSAQRVPFDATSLVRRAMQHRLDADKHHQPLRYLLHKTDEKHDTTKEIIETKDGDVARLIAINGKPLTAVADSAELARLNDLALHPELQQHRHQGEQKDQERVNRLMALLPDAFLFHLEATEPCPSGQCYRMSFTPNSHWDPPSMESKIFRGIAGEVWIDQAQERMTRIDAHFIADVDFGFGILGKVNKGGTALLEQADVGGNDWELTSLKLNVTGKALVLKSLSFQITEEASHFSPVAPNLNYTQAIQLLKLSSPAP